MRMKSSTPAAPSPSGAHMALFGAEKDKLRIERRDELLGRVSEYLRTMDLTKRPAYALKALGSGTRAIRPFHWEIEFPDVFGRENGGFDAVVGNPPFLGGTRVSTELGMSYFNWLTDAHPPAGHHCDLVAYFFRKASSILRSNGCFGLIATNTIAQGDTREGGLLQIVKDGGAIMSATRRYKWPGMAAVIVSIIHVLKGKISAPAVLDDRECDRISAFLFSNEVDDNPAKLTGGMLCSIGSKVYGQGFLFDENDPKASPLAQMQEVIKSNPSSAARIFPYLGGDEVNTSPTHSHHRYAIYVTDLKTEAELDQWPQLASIVREKVKPDREILGNNPNNVPLKRRWWAYQAHRPDLYEATRRLKRVLVRSLTSKYHCFTFVGSTVVYDQTVVVIANDTYQLWAAVSCRIHETWARFFGATLEDRPRYNIADCFENFPFPESLKTDPRLESAGQIYYDFRAALMVKNNEGLTKTYNRFHDPN